MYIPASGNRSKVVRGSTFVFSRQQFKCIYKVEISLLTFQKQRKLLPLTQCK